MKKVFFISFLFVACIAKAQLSAEVSQTAMNIWKDSFMLEGDKAPKWRYDQGVILKGIAGVWYATGDKQYFDYIQKSMDYYVSNDGKIKGYKQAEYNIDHVNNGKLLLLLYKVTGKEKYYKAAKLLREQLQSHPRTSEGSFWHKKIYPNQVWLDGLYMGQSFYAQWAQEFGEDSVFNDIAKQFVNIEKHARDAKTGLLYHGWDESKAEKWADKQTGLSPNVWARALGWYGMAMVDVLDYFPENHKGRKEIINVLNRFAKAVTAVQDNETGLWYDVVNLPNEPKNYFESSGSAMLVYTLAKAVRKEYINVKYILNAQKGYTGLVNKFIAKENGQTNFTGTVAVSGLGGKPYRDGSFEYYMSEPVITNDPKGVGAFINAAVEMEMLSTLSTVNGKTVLLDNYFNNETKKNAAGQDVNFHYTWNDMSNSGFSHWNNVFETYGYKTFTLKSAPKKSILKKYGAYIIVDPDTEKETAKPNYISSSDIKVIKKWVKKGGVLFLMANDTGNVELNHFNKLAAEFGVTFNNDSKNRVKNNNFSEGVVMLDNNEIFTTAKRLFIKEYASLSVSPSANVIAKTYTDNVIATTKYGKGTVFIIGDPWIYNEYTDGRKLPPDFDNLKAMKDIAVWLSKNIKR